MVSAHLLRPFSSRQLSLVEGDGRVMVFAALGGRFAGPSVLVHVPTLGRRVEELPSYVDTVAFIDEPVPDGALVNLVDDMLAEHSRLGVDALAQSAPITEAVKRVQGSSIREAIERSSLAVVRCPEVARREALERAVDTLAERSWVNVTVEIARSGGTVAFHGRSRVAATRP